RERLHRELRREHLRLSGSLVLRQLAARTVRRREMFRSIWSRSLIVMIAGAAFACELGEADRPHYTTYDQTLQQLVDGNPDLSTFKQLVSYTGFKDALSGGDSLTILAPNNAAFNALPAGTLSHLQMASTSTVIADELSALLRFHVLGGTIDTSLMKLGGEFR